MAHSGASRQRRTSLVMAMPRKRWPKYAAIIFFLTFLALTLKISNNLNSLDYVNSVFCEEGGTGEIEQGVSTGSQNVIPRHIHQIFFNATNKIIPKNLEAARQTWIKRHRAYNYTLWNESMVLDLIVSKYQELLPLYNGYDHWVKRADVGRYVILHEHGGLYADLDIGAKLSIEILLQRFDETTDVVLYFTKPVGVSNDFMISKARHPFFKHVICGLEAGNRWYVLPYLTTLMTTGPGFLYAEYKTYAQREQIEIIDESSLSPYLRHTEGGAWHGADGKAIWWIYIHRNGLFKAVSVIICAILIYVIFRIIFKIKFSARFIRR